MEWGGGGGGVPCVQFRVDFGLDCDESYLEQNCGTEIYQLALIKAASPTGEKVSLILSGDGLFVCFSIAATQMETHRSARGRVMSLMN